MSEAACKLFQEALEMHSLELMRQVPKSDLHNHVGRGGSIQYISQWAGVEIKPAAEPFASLAEMQKWFEENIKSVFPDGNGYLKRVEAAFVQAQYDKIEVLAMSYGLDEIDHLGSMADFVKIMDQMHHTFAPEVKFYPELSIGWGSDPDRILSKLDEILSDHWFCSLDLCGKELAAPPERYKKVYQRAKTYGLKLRAHVGEFGTAEDVKRTVELLELDEVHHGIRAAEDARVMNWLADHQIQLNICPTSNVMLKNSPGYDRYQLRDLYDHGIPVTINSDDMLIFNSSVSEEYLKLYQSGLMTVKELDQIRKNGLASYHDQKQRFTVAK